MADLDRYFQHIPSAKISWCRPFEVGCVRVCVGVRASVMCVWCYIVCVGGV